MKTIIIRKSEQSKSYRRKIDKLYSKGLDAYKYSGKLRITDDPVQIQKKLRNDWQ